MPETDIPIETAERFLEPLVAEWNRQGIEQLRTVRAEPFAGSPDVLVSFREAVSTTYGYEYLEFEFERPQAFRLCCRIEGTPGRMSFQTHHPVLQAEGDVAAALRWIGEQSATR